MSPEDRVRLEHMLDAARMAQTFMAGRQRADLDTDPMLLFAVTRAIGIVGEAASRISPEGRATLPDLPWKAIIAMRNRLIHAYFDINHEVVWQTATAELPPLQTLLQAALDT